MKQQKTNNWYVLTGGPSTGKTTLLKLLSEKGYQVVPEAARSVIDTHLADGISVEELRSDEKHFQELVVQRKADIESTLDPNAIIFFDRGMHDSNAYLRYYDFHIEDWIDDLVYNATYRKVFLLDQLDRYKDDYARVEDQAFRERIGELLQAAYEQSDIPVEVVPDIGLEKRLNHILNSI